MFDFWLILHFIGLTLGVGTGFAMMTLGLATKDMTPADRGAFMRRASALSKNGSVGLLLLIISGVALLLDYGLEAMRLWGPMFHIKLTLVAILIGVFGYMQVLLRQSRSTDPAVAGAASARMAIVSKVMLLLGVSIVISAVLTFH